MRKIYSVYSVLGSKKYRFLLSKKCESVQNTHFQKNKVSKTLTFKTVREERKCLHTAYKGGFATDPAETTEYGKTAEGKPVPLKNCVPSAPSFAFKPF